MLMMTMSIATSVMHRDFFRFIGQVFPFPLCKLLVFRVFSGLHDVVASSINWVAHPFTGLSSSSKLFYQILPWRFACVLARACAFDIALILEVALLDRSTIVLLRGVQVISCFLEVFVILPIFHSFGPFGYFSMLNQKSQGRT